MFNFLTGGTLSVHIVVAAKQVLDPEGVNSYALWGRLGVDESGRAFTIGETIPRIINAYDEQALEAALRIRDSGVTCTITAISVGSDANADVLKRCMAMGADAALLIRDPEAGRQDGFRTAALIEAAVRQLGDVDLVICGRQGSDFDQGVVPGVLAERLGWALVTLASDVKSDGAAVRVARVTPAGVEEVEAPIPAVVSVSNEIGIPRYPTSRGMLEARRKRPNVHEAEDLLQNYADAGVELVRLTVPDVQGHCEFIEGDSAAAKVTRLFENLSGGGQREGKDGRESLPSRMPPSSISSVTSSLQTRAAGMGTSVLVLITTSDPAGLTPAGREALGVANEVAEALGATLAAALLAPSAAATTELGERGAACIYTPEGVATDNPVAFAAEAIDRSQARVLIVSRGPDLLQLVPRLAARTGGGCVMQATAITVRDQDIEVTAAIYGGAARAGYRFRGDGPRIVALAPTGAEPPPRVTGRTGEVITIEVAPDRGVRVVSPAAQSDGARLEDARVVVSGGRGLRARDNYALIRELATALGGMPGASRAIVDEAWALAGEQVGLTGKVVTPDVYFAIGISGASQHMAGCSNARTLVAINTDPDAPIFRYATYGIVADCLELLPELIRQAKPLAGGPA